MQAVSSMIEALGAGAEAATASLSGRVATPLPPQGTILKTLDEYKGVLFSAVAAFVIYKLLGIHFLLFSIMALLVPFYSVAK